jgi:hypothetical protein
MRCVRNICLVFAVMGASPALAVTYAAPSYPGAPRAVYDDPAPAPYAMNYSEETARALGTHDGGLDLFDGRRGGMAPAVSVGSGAGAPMLKLQWRP